MLIDLPRLFHKGLKRIKKQNKLLSKFGTTYMVCSNKTETLFLQINKIPNCVFKLKNLEIEIWNPILSKRSSPNWAHRSSCNTRYSTPMVTTLLHKLQSETRPKIKALLFILNSMRFHTVGTTASWYDLCTRHVLEKMFPL